jgi:hypothetical protein
VDLGLDECRAVISHGAFWLKVVSGWQIGLTPLNHERLQQPS